jgi:hypothetical protein
LLRVCHPRLSEQPVFHTEGGALKQIARRAGDEAPSGEILKHGAEPPDLWQAVVKSRNYPRQKRGIAAAERLTMAP